MPTSIKLSEAKRGLKAKGFVSEGGKKHETFVYFYDNKRTALHASVSRGSKNVNYRDIDGQSITLNLRKKDVENLLNCPFTPQNMRDHYTHQRENHLIQF